MMFLLEMQSGAVFNTSDAPLIESGYRTVSIITLLGRG